MNSAVLATIAVTGFTVAFFHAAIPTHWLPFVLVSRARRWTRGKTLAVAALAGLGHVALTSLLGLVIAWFGFRLDEHHEQLFPWITGGFLIAIGLFYFWRQSRGRMLHHHIVGASHHASEHCGHGSGPEPSHWEDELKDSPLVSERNSDWAAISGLLVMLTLSPCEGFLPVYLSGVQFGWHGFIVLSLILGVGTLAGMMLFTWLTLIGLEKFELKNLERYEAALLGGIFTLLGLVLIFFEH